MGFGGSASGAGSDAAALENPSPLAFGSSTPHTVIDAHVESVIEAGILDWAGSTDLLGSFNAHAVAREEHRGRVIVAVAGCHPVVFHGVTDAPEVEMVPTPYPS